MKVAIVLGIFLSVSMVSVNAGPVEDWIDFFKRLPQNLKDFPENVRVCLEKGRTALRAKNPSQGWWYDEMDKTFEFLKEDGKKCQDNFTGIKQKICFAKHASTGFKEFEKVYAKLGDNETFIAEEFKVLTKVCLKEAINKKEIEN